MQKLWKQKDEEEKKLDTYIFNTQIEGIIRSYIKGIKLIMIWLIVVCSMLAISYQYTGLAENSEGVEFIYQVKILCVYLGGGLILLTYNPKAVIKLLPISIFVIMVVTINISTGSEKYQISEWMMTCK